MDFAVYGTAKTILWLVIIRRQEESKIMERVTKNNILKYIQMKKEYQITEDSQLLEKINRFTNEVINKDKKYFNKINSYNLNEEDLLYVIF